LQRSKQLEPVAVAEPVRLPAEAPLYEQVILMAACN
jgi:hypothetical protein